VAWVVACVVAGQGISEDGNCVLWVLWRKDGDVTRKLRESDMVFVNFLTLCCAHY